MPITKPYDVADYLTDDETVLAYLQEALDSNEPRLIAKAIAAVARARSRTMRTEQGRENSIQALSAILREGEAVDLPTAFQALEALGLKLTPALRQTAPMAA